MRVAHIFQFDTKDSEGREGERKRKSLRGKKEGGRRAAPVSLGWFFQFSCFPLSHKSKETEGEREAETFPPRSPITWKEEREILFGEKLSTPFPLTTRGFKDIRTSPLLCTVVNPLPQLIAKANPFARLKAKSSGFFGSFFSVCYSAQLAIHLSKRIYSSPSPFAVSTYTHTKRWSTEDEDELLLLSPASLLIYFVSP